eukprot:TRINITY_DN9761_c0_g5_i1.p1 TRINITY_DN9761_c0_g5~~TRINITY_DN9761_c0_g5_i1.p1  ORF type:complete len:294 (-),score=24.31 TRINITY_DN9761_c0_g5_i1:109-990(-)
MNLPDVNSPKHENHASAQHGTHTQSTEESPRVGRRKYTKKTIKHKLPPKPNQETWATISTFNRLFALVFSLYRRTREGKARTIISSLGFVFLIPTIGLLVYYLCMVHDIPTTVFFSIAAFTLLIYIVTLCAHILDETKKVPFTKDISDCDVLAFFIYATFTMMTLGFYRNENLLWEVLILVLSFLGCFVFSLMTCACVVLGVMFLACMMAELFAQVLFCRPCLKKDNDFVYLVFPYEEESTVHCTICLIEYTKDEMVCELKCHKAHIFHEECFLEWIKRKSICPICRKLIESR